MKEHAFIKRGVSLLLACLLIALTISGCSQSGNGTQETENPLGMAGGSSDTAGEGTRGRYMESEVTIPEELDYVYCMGKLSDGSIQIFGMDQGNQSGTVLKSGDRGENWTSTKVLEGWESGWSGRGIAASPDGTIFMPGSFLSPDGTEFEAVFILPDGSTKGITLTLPKLSDNQESASLISDAGFDADGNLYVSVINSGIFKVSMETGECTAFCDADGESIAYFSIPGNKLLAITRKGILVYNTADGTKQETDEVLSEWFKNNSGIASRETEAYPAVFAEGTEGDSTIYADNSGVYYYKEGGSVSEQLINGELNSLGDPNISFFSIVMMDEENILINVGSKILKYSYSREASAVPDQEIVVYSLYDSNALRQAVSVYQKENQNSSVQLVTGLSVGDGVTVDDALQTLNTDILAGNGPDVLILDGLPVESYIEKGILADISDIVAEVDASDGFFPNIKKAYEKDGSIYHMPARFYTIVVDGDEAALSAAGNLKSFADYAEQLKAQNQGADIFQPMMVEYMLEELYFADSVNWILADGTLDETKMQEWMVQAKRIWDVGAKYDEEGDSLEYQNLRMTNLIGTIQVGGTGMIAGANKIAFGTFTNADDLVGMRGTQAQTHTSYGLLNGDKTKSYVPYLLAGVNSTSSRMEEAENFVKVLLGREWNSMSGDGFPVNKAAFDAINEEKKTAYEEGTTGGIMLSGSDGNNTFTIDYKNLTDEDIAEMTEMLESLDTPVNTDRVLRNLILEQGEKYLHGEQSIEDTMTAIRQKVNLYLAE